MDPIDPSMSSSSGIDLVILTATVTPNVTSRLTVADPQVRLQQYQEAIASWERGLRHSRFSIAIVETSGAGRDDLLRGVDQDRRAAIETFAFEPSPSQTARGKGAIEVGAIAFALARHPGIRPDSTVYKCTGRLPLLNSPRVIQRVGPERVRVRMMADRSWADTRLVGARPEVWDRLVRSCVGAVDERAGYDFERVAAAHFASEAALKRLRIERFPERPHFGGVSGTSGRTYSPTASRARDALMRTIERALANIASRKQV